MKNELYVGQYEAYDIVKIYMDKIGGHCEVGLANGPDFVKVLKESCRKLSFSRIENLIEGNIKVIDMMNHYFNTLDAREIEVLHILESSTKVLKLILDDKKIDVKKVDVKKMEEARKARLAKKAKVIEESKKVNVDALLASLNATRNRNAELIHEVSKTKNEVKSANDEIATLKMMLALANEKIASLAKDVEELAIYKEMVEEETKIAA